MGRPAGCLAPPDAVPGADPMREMADVLDRLVDFLICLTLLYLFGVLR